MDYTEITDINVAIQIVNNFAQENYDNFEQIKDVDTAITFIEKYKKEALVTIKTPSTIETSSTTSRS